MDRGWFWLLIVVAGVLLTPLLSAFVLVVWTGLRGDGSTIGVSAEPMLLALVSVLSAMSVVFFLIALRVR